jgi:hypothetical protein
MLDKQNIMVSFLANAEDLLFAIISSSSEATLVSCPVHRECSFERGGDLVHEIHKVLKLSFACCF